MGIGLRGAACLVVQSVYGVKEMKQVARHLIMVALAGSAAGSAILSLGACGSRKSLERVDGMPATPTAYGADQPDTPDEMMISEPQDRPNRTIEPLLRSQERPDDPFSPPPK